MDNGRQINVLRVAKESETLRSKTAEALRNAILQLHFKPGERLIERELCAQTGVSRTSVREALRQLETEGLIETLPNKGPIVAELSVEALRCIQEVREALEGMICRLFTGRATEGEIDALERSVEDLEAAIARRDLAAAQKAREDFYDILHDGAGNDIARVMSRSLRARVTFLAAKVTSRWDEETGRATILRRRRIVAAIRARDAEGASAAQVEHLRAAYEISSALLERTEAAEAIGTA